MNRKTNVLLVIGLTTLSVLIYLVQYSVFHDSQNTIFYFFQDLAFVPIQVLLVTMILNRILNLLEDRKKIKKINVIISTFFVETGTSIIEALIEFDKNHEQFCEMLKTKDLSRKNNIQLLNQVRNFDFSIQANPEKLENLSHTLSKYRMYMLNMLGNDNLLEHDSFTDMLWATFHLNDELQTRGDFTNLEKSDREHLANDIFRAYVALIVEWISYMGYLNSEYPFLYTTALKKNPFGDLKKGNKDTLK